MAIAYVVGTNTITATGYTEATPCTFLDIYNADVAGGWGVVTRPHTDTYIIQALLHIGDGSTATWFKDTLKVIIHEVTGPTGWKDSNWQVLTNAHFQLGTLVNEANKRFKDGCIIYFDGTGYHCFRGGGDTKLYASCFYKPFDFCVENDGRVWGCQLVNSHPDSILYCRANWYQVSIYRAGWGFYQPSSANVFTNLVIDNLSAAFRLENTEVTARNIKIRNCTYVAYIYYTKSDYSYFIDFDVDNWAFLWYSAANARAYRQYSFDLKVQDKDENAINGATVKIWDKDNNLIVDTTTGAAGKITTQTLTYGYYDQAGGNTPTMQTPHTIQISKAGYQTYKKKSTLDEKISWRIRLLQAKPVQFLDNAPILQLCPESQEDDRTLFEVI